jgi:signal transduction histidine kinase
VPQLERSRPNESERAVAAERDRIMRELHDGLGGMLVSALAMVEDGTGSPEQLAELLRDALDEMRLVVDSLDAEIADLSALLGTLRTRLEPRLAGRGLRFEWKVEDVAAPSLPPGGLWHVLRILQEAVTNVRKHAAARVITVATGERAGADGRPGVWVALRDDGCGLPTDATTGRGFSNMRYRAAELGGVLEVSCASPGTLVELWLPARTR